MDGIDRRRLLRLLAATGATGATAGCGGRGDGETTAPTTEASPSTTAGTTSSVGTTADPTTAESTETTTATGEPTTTHSGPHPGGPEPPADMAAFRDALATTGRVVDDRLDAGPFDPTWDSLAGYEVPDWLRDRKFGIYFHWGLYSVPAYKYEWYPKWMYTPDREGWGSSVHDHHVETYGDPETYPYQRFAGEFSAPEFDPEAWADLFAAASAGFAGPVVEHHDGWSNWASGINPYNAAVRGPERDLVGELETAIRARDMKFVTTFHHGRAARADRRVPGDRNYAGAYYGGAYDNYPSVTEGFPNRVMYKNLADAERWDMWLGKLVEVCERYEPDLVWHDSLHVPPEDVKRRYLAYNLNRAAAQDRDVAITYKAVEYTEVVGSDTLTRDYENDVADSIQPDPWLADINVANGAWCHTTQQSYRPVGELVGVLVDVVAKNGQVLLNVPPMADGSFPPAVEDRLRGIGDWLNVNGAAIFGTRPWTTWRDGGSVRYTRSADGDTLYAVVEGYPGGDRPLAAVPTPAGDATVRFHGHGEIPYRVEQGTVVLEVPDLQAGEWPSDHAASFALEGFL